MPKTARYAFAFLSFTFLLAAIVVLAKSLAGEDEMSLVVPCALLLMGLGIGAVPWYFSWSREEVAQCLDTESNEGESEEVSAKPDGE